MMKWVGGVGGTVAGLASVIGIYAWVTGDEDAPWISKPDSAQVQQASVMAANRGVVRCIVADPTNDPLNVRVAPQAETIVIELPDGVQVWRTNAAPDARQNDWAQIALSEGAAPSGWVWAQYLDCEEAG